MTESTRFEARLADALGRYADLAPVEVDELWLLTTVADAPRTSWRSHLPASWPRLLPRLLLVGLLVAAIVAAALVGVGSLWSRPAPTGVADRFAVPFSYALPADTPLRLTVGPRRTIVGWSAGTLDLSDPATGSDTPGIPDSWETHGVYVGVGEDVWGHGFSSRYELQHEPTAFIADLRDVSHIPMTATEETTLDGRPAATATLMGGSGIGGRDIHLNDDSISAPSFIRLDVPARLIVAEVDDTTIFVLVWARSAEALDAWMPDAERFVESIRFLPR